jgi:hypothetical protein
MTQLTRRMIFVLTVTLLGLSLTYYAYFPGLMPPDAVDQLRQAESGRYVDWHPPIMAWLWSLTIPILPGPQGFFVVITSLYWGGFYMVSANFARYDKSNKYIAAGLLPFMPFLFNFAGTIWKDVLVFGCFLCAVGLSVPRIYGKQWRVGSLAVLFTLLMLGSLARHNSVLAAIPIFVLYVWPRPALVQPLMHLVRRSVVCGFIVIAAWAGAERALNRFVFHAEKAGIVNSIFLWDLAGISHRVGTNLLPGDWSEAESKDIIGPCYNPVSVNSLLFYNCRFVFQHLKHTGQWSSGLLSTWLDAVISHPIDYLIVRAAFVRTLAWPNNTFVYAPEKDSYDYGFSPNMGFNLVSETVRRLAAAPGFARLFAVGFWIIAAGLVWAISLVMFLRGDREYFPALLLSLSAVLYVWPIPLLGVAGDLRYAYWSIVATCLSALTWPISVRDSR